MAITTASPALKNYFTWVRWVACTSDQSQIRCFSPKRCLSVLIRRTTAAMIPPISLFPISILTLITSSFSASVEPPPGNQFQQSYIKPCVGFHTRPHPYHPPQTIPQGATLTSSANAFHLQNSSAAPAQSIVASTMALVTLAVHKATNQTSNPPSIHAER